MKLSEVREVIRQVIAEAKENGGLPKSGGKLVHLKKEMEGLKKMKESLGQLQIAEGGDQQFVAEYAHMQKFVNELEKIKAAHAKLSEMLDGQINEVDGKIKSETEKIKEMMGLIEKAKKEPKEKKEKKTAHEKGETKAEEKEEHKKEEKNEALNESALSDVLAALAGASGIGLTGMAVAKAQELLKKKNPELYAKLQGIQTSMSKQGVGMDEAKEEELDEARFEKGEDVGEKGKNFAKIAKSAGKKYGSKEAGQKVAGAILKKVVAKK